MTHELGPLPEPEYEAESDDCTYACPEGYSADQMRSYAAAEVARAVAAEREQCANVCEDQSQEYEPFTEHPLNLAYQCANAIRALT